MFELFCILIGVLFGGGAVYLLLRRKFVAQVEAQKYNSEYYALWSEAVSLLGLSGQLTPEQIAKITPAPKQLAASQTPRLPKGQGFSEDRRDIEIRRAEKGLPPADNLKGMFSEDVRDVHEARIKYGTAQ